jgi:hypothetical protein
MDKTYYDRCGEIMIKSFEKYWSNKLPLHVYTEGDNFNVTGKNIIDLGWNLGSQFDDFVDRWNIKKKRRVVTFAKKAFSIIDAMEKIDCDRLIWIDADTIIKQEISGKFLKEISPDDTLSTHFSVWHEHEGKEYHSCETGFFILNKSHHGFIEFCETYKHIYVNDDISQLRRFYDGEVYGRTVDLMKDRNYKMLNLSDEKRKTPIPRSKLAPYIDHLKSGLKDQVDKEEIKDIHKLL